jgi:protein phosphatase
MMSLTLEVAGKTDVGCVRTNNEDNFGYDMRHGIFVVCDGMGGSAAGEVASKMGVDTMLTYFREAGANGHFPQVVEPLEGLSERGNALSSAIHLANTAIHEAAQRHAAHAGMGSTIVSVLMDKELFSVGHVGDSRVYLIRGGDIQQITQDHSLVMEYVRRGLISLEEAERSDVQNVIMRALGSEEKVEPDLEDMVAMPGDILLLASDGLTKYLKPDQILALITISGDMEEACDRLIQAAKDAGGDDNITCLLIHVVERPWYARWLRRVFLGEGSPKWQSST